MKKIFLIINFFLLIFISSIESKEINGEIYKGIWSNGELTKPKK